MGTFVIPVSESWKPFIEEAVSQSGLHNAGEYVEALLLKAKLRQAEDYLERLILQAEQNGDPEPWTSDARESVRHELCERLASDRNERGFGTLVESVFEQAAKKRRVAAKIDALFERGEESGDFIEWTAQSLEELKRGILERHAQRNGL